MNSLHAILAFYHCSRLAAHWVNPFYPEFFYNFLAQVLDRLEAGHRHAQNADLQTGFWANYFKVGVMIKDASTLGDVRAQWNAVCTLASRGATGAQVPGGPYINFPQKDSRFYNLPFLLAYATLEQVLEQLAYEGTIPSPKEKPTLHTRMKASQSHLSWQSFATVDEGKKRRNALAHDATLLDEQDCLHYIRAVEEELVAWSIIQK